MDFKTKDRRQSVGNRPSLSLGAAHESHLWSWFTGSQIVDMEGKPLRLFHGTNQDFDAFDRTKSRDDGLVYLSPNPRVASAFALYRSTWQGANVMPVYVRAQSLLEIDGGYGEIREVEKTHRPAGMLKDESIAQYMKRNRIEAIVYRNVRDDVGPSLVPFSDVYVIAPGAQIKSAVGNAGTFSTNETRITR